MRRLIPWAEEHHTFRAGLRRYLEQEVVPRYPTWREAGHVPRDLYRDLGRLGVMGFAVPERHGGGSTDDYRYNVIVQEEAARASVGLGTLRTHLDIVLPYFLRYADEDQQDRWFPGLATGELFSAIALTEPGTGSDLAGVSTRAQRDGDHYVLDGAKTFITGGLLADLVIVLARTGQPAPTRRDGLSLIVVEKGTPGFKVGRRLRKLGLWEQDTVELSFDQVRVPTTNLLGEEGHAFTYLTSNLAQERLAISVGAVAQSQAALDATVAYVNDRTVFGQPLSSMQNTRFELAAVAAELAAAQALLDQGVLALRDGVLAPEDAARVKLFCTEVQGRVMDRCLQLHGGYGYVDEYPIARLYADARVTRIYGGTSEVMKLIISKSLGLRPGARSRT